MIEDIFLTNETSWKYPSDQ